MKYPLTLALVMITAHIFACNNPHFGLALNQRSFYNPASLCPYCVGSTFMSGGLSFIPGSKDNSGFNYAFGNDAANFIHGPWDLAYAQMQSPGVTTKAVSMRYAYAMLVGKWKAAIGMRGSYYSIHGNGDAQFSTKFFDADAGMMVTNQKGMYFGMSMLHLGGPTRAISNETGITYSVALPQTFNAMAGYVQKINSNWDVLPDVSFLTNKTENVFIPGAMVRLKHHYALGGGMTFASNEHASYQVRAGYMSSKFKFLASASPGAEGWIIETGITWRFGFTQDCDGGTCSVKKPWKKIDDFLKHR
ncbi:hypothetical protein BH11BAC7_BH11BAC7_28340 [soil metagenome]